MDGRGRGADGNGRVTVTIQRTKKFLIKSFSTPERRGARNNAVETNEHLTRALVVAYGTPTCRFLVSVLPERAIVLTGSPVMLASGTRAKFGLLPQAVAVATITAPQTQHLDQSSRAPNRISHLSYQLSLY